MGCAGCSRRPSDLAKPLRPLRPPQAVLGDPKGFVVTALGVGEAADKEGGYAAGAPGFSVGVEAGRAHDATVSVTASTTGAGRPTARFSMNSMMSSVSRALSVFGYFLATCSRNCSMVYQRHPAEILTPPVRSWMP